MLLNVLCCFPLLTTAASHRFKCVLMYSQGVPCRVLLLRYGWAYELAVCAVVVREGHGGRFNQQLHSEHAEKCEEAADGSWQRLHRSRPSAASKVHDDKHQAGGRSRDAGAENRNETGGLGGGRGRQTPRRGLIHSCESCHSHSSRGRRRDPPPAAALQMMFNSLAFTRATCVREGGLTRGRDICAHARGVEGEELVSS